MKKILLPALAALIIIISVISCKKTYCWQCAIYKTNSKGQLSNTASETLNVCDKTQDQINDYQQENRVTQKFFNGSGYQENTIQSMRCTK